MIALREVRGSAARLWLERAYKDWLIEIGANPAEIVAAQAAVAVALAADDVQVLLIERAGQPAGFATIRTRLETSTAPPTLYRLEDFFVVPEFRRLGIGAAAARLLFERFAGSWEIVSLQRHDAAIRFWRRLLHRYAEGRVSESRLAGEIRYRFASNGAR